MPLKAMHYCELHTKAQLRPGCLLRDDTRVTLEITAHRIRVRVRVRFEDSLYRAGLQGGIPKRVCACGWSCKGCATPNPNPDPCVPLTLIL
jgi:hypothetical protein